MLHALLLAALVAPQGAPAPPPAATLERPAARPAWAEAVVRGAEEQGLVGLAAALVEDGTIVELHHGLADREAAVPVGPTTRFRWASISKPLTAVAAYRLHLEGALDLDADVRTLVPEFPEKPWPVTPRQLLGHLGGVVHYANGPVIRTERRYLVEHPFRSTILALDTFAESPLIAEPGTRYAYTTHGYMLLGAAVERAAGRPFAEHVRVTVLDPLGMGSCVPDDQWSALPHRAVGYRRVGEEVIRSTDTDVSWKLPGGGYLSTVGDLARFARALATADERLLPREHLDVMWTPMRTADGESTNYGMGFGVRRRDGVLRVAHSGAQEKTRTLMQLWPDEGRALVLMTNSEYAQLAPIAEAARAALVAAGAGGDGPR